MSVIHILQVTSLWTCGLMYSCILSLSFLLASLTQLKLYFPFLFLRVKSAFKKGILMMQNWGILNPYITITLVELQYALNDAMYLCANCSWLIYLIRNLMVTFQKRKENHLTSCHFDCRFLEAIERNKDCAFYYFLLGKLYWEMNGNLRADKKKCLAQFLKVEIRNKTINRQHNLNPDKHGTGAQHRHKTPWSTSDHLTLSVAINTTVASQNKW